MELDAYELETLLGNDTSDTSNTAAWTGDPFAAEAPEFNALTSCKDVMLPQAIPDMLVDSNGAMSTTDDRNVLIITVPESLQEAAVFNKFPTIPLDSNVVQKINQTVAGCDGAFLRLSKNTSKRPLSPIRRSPLQVIQQIVNASKPKNIRPKAPITSCKRKQRFDLTREDGIIFVGGSTSPDRSVKRQRRSLKSCRDESFVWALTKDEEPIRIPEAVDETKRCPGCKKIFKKLTAHKCKKLQQPAATTENLKILKCSICKKTFQSLTAMNAHEKTHANVICLGCKDEFTTKLALSNHLNKCNKHVFVLERQTVSMRAQKKGNISKMRHECKINECCKRQTRSNNKKHD